MYVNRIYTNFNYCSLFVLDKNESSLMSKVHFEESSEDEDEDEEGEDEEPQENGVEEEDNEPGLFFDMSSLWYTFPL